MPAGRATIGLDFTHDGGGPGKGGAATLSVNGQQIAQERIARTPANVSLLDEGSDLGLDEDTHLTEAQEAGAKSRLIGTIDKVTIQVR